MADSSKIEMRPEDMFPETDEPFDPAALGLSNPFHAKPADNKPPARWLYRQTTELRPQEVITLFQPRIGNVLRDLKEKVEHLYGTAVVDLSKIRIPNAGEDWHDAPSKSRLVRLANRFARTFLDMVPKGQLDYERALAEARIGPLVARAKIEGARDLSAKVSAEIDRWSDKVFPHPNAKTVEGKDFRDQRTVAVWGGVDPVTGAPTEPTEDPSF